MKSARTMRVLPTRRQQSSSTAPAETPASESTSSRRDSSTHARAVSRFIVSRLGFRAGGSKSDGTSRLRPCTAARHRQPQVNAKARETEWGTIK